MPRKFTVHSLLSLRVCDKIISKPKPARTCRERALRCGLQAPFTLPRRAAERKKHSFIFIRVSGRLRPDTAAQGETALTKRIFITFCAAAACCVLLGACESGSLAAAAGKRTRPADLGELQFITPAEGDPIATLSTTLGDISFVLYPDIAPMAVENFVGLAQQGYYNGLSFHRVIEGFLVQTGDATGTGAGGSTIWNGNSYPNEISDRLHHYAGAVAMAHAPDGASGNLSQFYIVQSAQDSVDKTLAKTLTEAGVREAVVTAYQAVGGAPYLDNLNTVFGQVYDGMDVVDAIAAWNAAKTTARWKTSSSTALPSALIPPRRAAARPASGASGSDSAA